jgi:hypothetical protein
MVGTGLVILGAILMLVVIGALRSQEPPPVAVEVREDAARSGEVLGRHRVRDGR